MLNYKNKKLNYDSKVYVCFNCGRIKHDKDIHAPCLSCGSENVKELKSFVTK